MPNLDDGTKDELIHGEVVRFPLAGALHGEVCGAAGMMLGLYKRQHGGVATIGSGVIVARNPDSALAPDAAYWRERPAWGNQWPEVPPNAVFEIVDHDEEYHHIQRKVLLYRQCGVGVLWVVAPLCDCVTEYRGNRTRLLGPDYTLDGGDVLPGFSCKVADLFG